MLPRSESPLPESHLLVKSERLPPSSPLPSSAATSSEHPLKFAKSAASALHLHHRHRLGLFLFLLFLQLLLLLSARSFPTPRLLLFLRRHHSSRSAPAAVAVAAANASRCTTGRIYVYDLPPAFNSDILAACDANTPWVSHCAAFSNYGFGPPAAEDVAGVVPAPLLSSWYGTDQFATEVIFHHRALHHPCRTTDPAAADAFFIPFYAGLAVARHLWSQPNSTDRAAADDYRDRECAALLQWIAEQLPWKRSNGSDHFMVLGRITWDFRRSTADGWGSSFLHMTGMGNVTRFLIERDPWDVMDVGIPYPTAFHPRTAADIREWQRFVLNRTRSTLFGFAGAVRTGQKDDFRGLLLDECRRASADANGTCRSVDCSGSRCVGSNRRGETLNLFLDSTFCLQPRGDSFTRRSMFDCMVAGAVPVLFWQRSAHKQYTWYLQSSNGSHADPNDEEGAWSVFIDRRAVRSGKTSVREVLEGIGEARARRMRERVVEMLPRLVYAAAPEGLGEGLMDAFDVAVEGALRRFRQRRQ